MIKLKSLLMEDNDERIISEGYYSVIVGVITSQGEIKSEETSKKSHRDLGFQRGMCWRYNPIKKTIYWHGDSSEHDESDEINVKQYLYKKYGYEVEKNITLENIFDDSYDIHHTDTHGIYESHLNIEEKTNNLLTVYQGRSVYNRGSKYFTTDKEWAINFTQSGQEKELTVAKIDTSLIYEENPLPQATNEKMLEKTIEVAKAMNKGYKAIWVDEGAREPRSIFIMDMSVIRIVKPSSIKESKSITEKFDLPINLDNQSEVLAKYIASLLLSATALKRLKFTSKQYIDDEILVINKLKQYQRDGPAYFKTKSYKMPTNLGWSSFAIESIHDENFPKVFIGSYVKRETRAYIDMTSKNIVIFIDIPNFLNNFDHELRLLMDAVKHEVRHWLQLTRKIGQPKSKILGKKRNFLNYNAELPHHLRNMEFKPNVHTYALHIKNYLNKRYSKSEWDMWFKDLIMGNYEGNIGILGDVMIKNINNMRIVDKNRWKQFVKELYKEVFS